MEIYFKSPENVNGSEGTRAGNEAGQDGSGTANDQARPHSSDEETHKGVGYMLNVARMATIERLRRKPPPDCVGGGAPEVGRFAGQDVSGAIAATEQPEVQRMLKSILAEEGGGQVVERLKELDAAAAAAAACRQSDIGGLIENYYVPLLLSILELSDARFDAEYPGETPVSAEQRRALAAAIQEHATGRCPRCSAKYEGDMEWENHVEGLFGRAERSPLDSARRDEPNGLGGGVLTGDGGTS